jgi:tRNA G18 (ribose-2'-O)-methylase SpoU
MNDSFEEIDNDCSRAAATDDQATGTKKRMADGNVAREEKRRKWEAKQARQQQEVEKEKSRASWIQANSAFSSLVTDQEIDSIRSSNIENASKLEPLLTPYFDIQDKPKKEVTKHPSAERLFIAEGTETIRILIQQSTIAGRFGLEPIQLKSIFLKPSLLFEPPVDLVKDVKAAAARINRGKEIFSPGFHVLVGSESALTKVAGFPVSRGALACGVVPSDRNENWLDSFLKRSLCGKGSKNVRLLALDGICDTANLGSMVRCASAFGIDAIVLSHDTCDCWYRRAIRVSMGHIFKVPVVRVGNLAAEIQKWSSDDFKIKSYAAVLDTDDLLEDIARGGVPPSWCCVMGNESKGISPAVAKACTQRIRIDIVNGVDSLSVPIACGVLLHGLKERERKVSPPG